LRGKDPPEPTDPSLRGLVVEIEHFYRVTRVNGSQIDLRNLVRNTILVTFSAWENKRKTGCHFRGMILSAG